MNLFLVAKGGCGSGDKLESFLKKGINQILQCLCASSYRQQLLIINYF